MNKLDNILRGMTFEFFGSGQHKIEMETLLATKDAVFLDVRSRHEWESVQIKLEHHIRVLWIPIEKIPERFNELPRDKVIGVFCTSSTRSAIVYAYLRSIGYDNVRVTPSGYEAITNLLMPGKLYKSINAHKIEREGQ